TWTEHDPYATGILLGPLDLHLFSEGQHWQLYEMLGAHLREVDGVRGTAFHVWAPKAQRVSVVGEFNGWDGRRNPMRKLLGCGVWEIFLPGVGEGAHYKFEVRQSHGAIVLKSDPFAFFGQHGTATASLVFDLKRYAWNDAAWLEARRAKVWHRTPMSIYEVHLGSWQRRAEEGDRFLSYRELADTLLPYVVEMGYTHLELLPVAEHPFEGSWGYQVTGYFAPTSRFGNPDEFRYFVDRCHQAGVGVILDWVPGHFPKDAHGLAFFDGTHLYEHGDPRIGEHKEWGTLIFNYSRNEVRNFLVANLVYWFEEFHIDGIRVDAVASMLYRDYLRPEGEWIANEHGGRENTEAVRFLQQANHVLFQHFPGALSIAEESTTWPLVTQPTDIGGLGFNLKWNMGWMHDMLDYFEMDPWFRQFHQNNVTFSIWYAFTENFMLALSHDEVVHGKSNLLHKMPGDDWQKFANVRALLAYMWTHPGKKTIFMGMEFGQRAEWNVWGDLQWELLQYEPHQGLQRMVDDLNVFYKSEPALWRDDFNQYGFQWIDCNDNTNSVISFMRRESITGHWLVVVANFTPQTHSHYRVGVPLQGFYAEVFNSDSGRYGGSNIGNLGGKFTDDWALHSYEQSLDLCLPPLSVLVFRRDEVKSLEREANTNLSN
ncbi:MAG: 1,4-alpha-glucan branching protein GlgB, partial [Cyanobacteriota bacterium]